MQAQLNQFDTASELRLIQSISNTIQSSPDPLRQANSVITSFGVAPVAEAVDARVVALTLAEFAFKHDEFTVDKAISYAEKRYEKLATKNPWGHKQLAVKLQPLGEGQGVDIVSDKKAKALAIFNELTGKVNNNQIAKRISEALGISVANSAYYVTRVFTKH